MNFFLGPNGWDKNRVTAAVEVSSNEEKKHLLVGKKDARTGVITFKGVPYAQPPVGPLRFKKPVPFTPSVPNSSIECLNYAPASVQPYPLHTLLQRSIPDALAHLAYFKLSGMPAYNTNPKRPYSLIAGVSEDCLYLNVTTTTLDPGAKLPVMVWIHGGAFTYGQGTERPWTEHEKQGIVRRGVVNVAINYRLGVLGFTKVEGGDWNCGLWDQVAALEWVQRNIASLGGDPSNVTLYGESAGGVSIVMLAASALNCAGRLFHKAIMQSGAWQATLTTEESHTIGRAIAKTLGLSSLTHEELSHFSSQQILAAQVAVMESRTLGFLIFQPIIDGEFLTDYPSQLLRAGSAKGVPCMVLYHEEEEGYFAKIAPEVFAASNKDELLKVVSFSLGPAMVDVPDPMASAVAIVNELQAYLSQDDEMQGRQEDWFYICVLFCSYFRYGALSVQLAEALRQTGSPVYLSRFLVPSPTCSNLRPHLLDLPYLFGTWRRWSDMVPKWRFRAEEHDALVEAMQEAWTSFAKTGVPSPQPAWVPLPVTKAGWKAEAVEELPAMQFELPFCARMAPCRVREASPTLWRIVEENTVPHYLWNQKNFHRYKGVPTADNPPTSPSAVNQQI